MLITDETKVSQIAELMGHDADEIDGRIMLSLLIRECVTDTNNLDEDQWMDLLNESQRIRHTKERNYK